MPKKIFWSLLLLNLMAFAWVGTMDTRAEQSGREPQRVKAQLAAEKIRILPATVATDTPAQSATAAASK